jgi:hypothetical protein
MLDCLKEGFASCCPAAAVRAWVPSVTAAAFWEAVAAAFNVRTYGLRQGQDAK